jgi:hypothetical protein
MVGDYCFMSSRAYIFLADLIQRGMSLTFFHTFLEPLWKKKRHISFEVFTMVTMKNAIFWDVAPCRSCVNRLFGGTYRLHLQGRKIRGWGTSVSRWLQTADFSTLKMEVIRTSETSVHARSTQRHIPEDGILQEKTWLFLQDGATANYSINVLSEMFEDRLIGCRLCDLQGLQIYIPFIFICKEI